VNGPARIPTLPALLGLAALLAGCSSSSSNDLGDAGSTGGPDAGKLDGTTLDGSMGDDAGEDGGADAGADAQEDDAATSDAAPEASGPPPTVLASDVPNPSYLVTDGQQLYWTDFVETDAGQALGRVMKMPVAGGAEVTLATEPGRYPAGLAVDTASAYWVDDQGTLFAAPLIPGGDAGAPVTLATGAAASSIAADGQFVYVESGLGAGVARVPIDGGAAVTLASPDAGFAPAGIAIDTANVYWPAPAGGAILAVPKGGGPTITLVSNPEGGAGAYVSASGYQNVASDGTVVVWNRYPGSAAPSGGVLAVVLVADGGGPPSLLYDAGAATPFSVATDGVSVYFLTGGSAPALMRAPFDGGDAVILAADQFAAGITGDPGPTVAVDTKSVYWLSPPHILRTAK
jgi:hypothetical protein